MMIILELHYQRINKVVEFIFIQDINNCIRVVETIQNSRYLVIIKELILVFVDKGRERLGVLRVVMETRYEVKNRGCEVNQENQYDGEEDETIGEGLVALEIGLSHLDQIFVIELVFLAFNLAKVPLYASLELYVEILINSILSFILFFMLGFFFSHITDLGEQNIVQLVLVLIIFLTHELLGIHRN